jgi:SAP domain
MEKETEQKLQQERYSHENEDENVDNINKNNVTSFSSTVINYSILKIVELKKKLKSRGLAVSGNKSNLIKYLQDNNTKKEERSGNVS